MTAPVARRSLMPHPLAYVFKRELLRPKQVYDMAYFPNAVKDPKESGGVRNGKAPRPAPLVRDPTLPLQAHQLPDLDAICAVAVDALLAAGFGKVDYVAVRHADTLKVVTEAAPARLRVLAAAWLGNTRLIDNVGSD